MVTPFPTVLMKPSPYKCNGSRKNKGNGLKMEHQGSSCVVGSPEDVHLLVFSLYNTPPRGGLSYELP